MAQYVVVINNDERLANGEEDDTLANVKDEVEELLGSGYFEVESVVEVTDVSS